MKKVIVIVFGVFAVFNCIAAFCQTSSSAKLENYVRESVSGVPYHYKLYMALINSRNSDVSIPLTSIFGGHIEPKVKFVELQNKVKLEYVEQGDASGIPVVFLHGLSDSWHSYELVLPHLPKSIHAFVISQRGHGDSDRPLSAYHTRDFAADVKAFMDKLQIGPAIIVGHSMGSMIAQRFVLDNPQRTRGLVLIGTFAKYAGNQGVSELEAVISTMKDPIDPTFAKEFQQSTLTKPIPPEYFNTVVQESLKMPARVWKSIVEGWGEVHYVDELNKFNRPTLILWGEKDAFCPRADQDILSCAIQNSQLLIYPGTGHAVHWEEPGKFAEDIISFTKRVADN